MRFISGLIFHIFANFVALWAATYFIPGFIFKGTFLDLLMAAAILTAINYLLKPILKLLLGPFIVLSLGLLTIVINAATLYLLDIFSSQLTIEGLMPLFLGTLIVSLTNLTIHGAAKFLYRRS